MTKNMNKPKDPTSPTADTLEIKHRLIVPIQTRGNLGKSTEAIARCHWMTERGIDWRGYDLDSFNRTLSGNYPDKVTFIPQDPEPEGDVIQILRKVVQAEVTVIDPAAHMNQTILRAIEQVQFTKFAEAGYARLTVLIFPIDEISDMEDITRTVASLRDTVDWVVVRNPAKIPTTKFFAGSQLEARLRSYNAAFLTLPVLMGITRRHLRACEARVGRPISPDEAVRNPEIKMDLVHRCLLEDWLKKTQREFDAIATHLLPTAKAAGIETQPSSQETSTTEQRGAGLNFTEAA